MATNCPPQMASVDDDDEQRIGKPDGVLLRGPSPAVTGAAVLDRIGQLVCGIHGHDNLIHFEQYRMFLKCVSCGHESPGWRLPNRRPLARAVDENRQDPTDSSFRRVA